MYTFVLCCFVFNSQRPRVKWPRTPPTRWCYTSHKCADKMNILFIIIFCIATLMSSYSYSTGWFVLMFCTVSSPTSNYTHIHSYTDSIIWIITMLNELANCISCVVIVYTSITAPVIAIQLRMCLICYRIKVGMSLGGPYHRRTIVKSLLVCLVYHPL